MTVVQPAKLTNTAEIQKAQRNVGTAMGSCLLVWWVPVISGVVTAKIEKKLIKETLTIMGCYTETASEKVFWFFRQKTFFLYVGTYLPGLGVPLQLLETYGIGQFAIHCALRPELLTNEAWLQQSWNDIEPDILSGEHAIQSYEQFTGSTFPDYARKKFLATVNFVNQLYLCTQKYPGADKAQKGLAEIAEEAMHFIHRHATKVASDAERKINAICDRSETFRLKLEAKIDAKKAARLAKQRNVNSDTKG